MRTIIFLCTGLLCTNQESSDLLDWFLRRRQADTRQAPAAQRFEAFERQRQMRAALVRRQRVDFVDDYRARARQHRATGFGTKQDVQRFRGRDDDVWRLPAHAVAFGLRRVAGAHDRADFDVRQTEHHQFVADTVQRRFEIDADIVRQRLEWRHVDDEGFVGQGRFDAAAHEVVDRGEEGGECLA
jgi:hypothetical protein